jgi:ribonucleoside-triphosphate reductase
MGKCQERVECWSRVVGFYRPVQHWNMGKKAEFENRNEYELEGNKSA